MRDKVGVDQPNYQFRHTAYATCGRPIAKGDNIFQGEYCSTVRSVVSRRGLFRGVFTADSFKTLFACSKRPHSV